MICSGYYYQDPYVWFLLVSSVVLGSSLAWKNKRSSSEPMRFGRLYKRRTWTFHTAKLQIVVSEIFVSPLMRTPILAQGCCVLYRTRYCTIFKFRINWGIVLFLDKQSTKSVFDNIQSVRTCRPAVAVVHAWRCPVSIGSFPVEFTDWWLWLITVRDAKLLTKLRGFQNTIAAPNLLCTRDSPAFTTVWTRSSLNDLGSFSCAATEHWRNVQSGRPIGQHAYSDSSLQEKVTKLS